MVDYRWEHDILLVKASDVKAEMSSFILRPWSLSRFDPF